MIRTLLAFAEDHPLVSRPFWVLAVKVRKRERKIAKNVVRTAIEKIVVLEICFCLPFRVCISPIWYWEQRNYDKQFDNILNLQICY